MRRREFLGALGGAAGAWPLAARAQQPKMPVIGFLRSTAASDSVHLVAAFRKGLSEAGFIEGQNVVIESRFADGQNYRLAGLAAELIDRQVSVIVATGGTPPVVAAKGASTTIPIVFVIGSDPVKDGIVGSFNRPGGNVTGVTLFTYPLLAKRLELLHELVPSAKTVAFLVDPNNLNAKSDTINIGSAARAVGQKLVVVNASTERDFEPAFATVASQVVGALVVGAGAFFNSRREQLVTLAAQHSIPTIYELREFVTAGGLMSYGTSITDAHRQAGVYVGKILKGAKPADLPVMQPTKFELIINLKTAKTLGLDVSLQLQQLADEVIE
jgi:putative ABC transport system substrate-binding protein